MTLGEKLWINKSVFEQSLYYEEMPRWNRFQRGRLRNPLSSRSAKARRRRRTSLHEPTAALPAARTSGRQW